MNLVKLTRFITLICICSCIYSCKCPELPCQGMDTKYLTLLPNKLGDTIKFENTFGDKMHFVVNDYSITQPQTFDCGGSYPNCKCPPECPTPTAYHSAETDDKSRFLAIPAKPVRNYDIYEVGISKLKDKKDTVISHYRILDHGNYFALEPSLKLYGKDSLLSSYTFGSQTYTDVIFHERDTTAELRPVPIWNLFFVLKSYYSIEHGVLSFFDLKTNSWFYRKP